MIALLFLSILAAAASQCTLCTDGVSNPSNGTIGTTPCTLIASEIASTPSDASACIETQLAAHRYCECPTFPDSYCRALTNCQFPTRRMIGSTAIICADLEFASVNDCHARAASYCGCSEEPTLTVCDYCTTSDRADWLLPPDFVFSCRDYADADAYYSIDGSCDSSWMPPHVEYQAYCGCRNATTDTVCTLCPDDFQGDARIGSQTTCADVLERVAPVYTNCTAFQDDFATLCCASNETKAPTTKTPTAMPTTTTMPVLDRETTSTGVGTRIPLWIWAGF